METIDMNRVRYADFFEGLDAEQIRAVAEVKRFMECYSGDRQFMKAVEAGGKFTEEQLRMLKDIGISFEPEAMALLWRQPDLVDSLPNLVASHEQIPPDVDALLAPYPEFRLWSHWRHRHDRTTVFRKLKLSRRATDSPVYTAWRGRRVWAARNELGPFGWSLDHPCHAVEMAVGCSVGCGFCAFDAPKLETVFDFSLPENRELVRGVATGMAKVLGWPAAAGMLYWSTEPHDNPHYVELLKLWDEVTGVKLCTATARAEEQWIGKLIEFYSAGPAGRVPWPRVSVLTRKHMRRLHQAFTPLEMRDTTLLMQQKEAEVFRGKVPGGRDRMLRQLVDADDLRNVDFENLPEGFEPPQGSIACISGFLVNMVQRTLKLISPCYTTMEYRYGYRVFDETTFDGPEDFEVALKRVIARSMVEYAYPEMPIKWRDDLKVAPRPDGFTLLSPTTRRDFRKGELHLRTAELVSRGDLTYSQAFELLSDNPAVGPMTAMSMLDSLFRKGFLCELAITRDYRARQDARTAGEAAPPRRLAVAAV